MNMASLSLYWATCVDLLKDRVNNRSFWEALERVHPITIENGILVLGLDGDDSTYASHIQQSAHMNAVVRAVQERFNQPLQVRLIDGTTVADWEATKVRDQRVAASRQVTIVRQNVERVASGSWEGISEAIALIYSQTPNRNLPQGKARFANEALYVLAESMDTVYPDDADEPTERALARALDRISSNADIPAPILAFELERLRAWRKANTESAEAEADMEE